MWCPIFIPDLWKIARIQKSFSRGFCEQNQILLVPMCWNNRHTLFKDVKDLTLTIDLYSIVFCSAIYLDIG